MAESGGRDESMCTMATKISKQQFMFVVSFYSNRSIGCSMVTKAISPSPATTTIYIFLYLLILVHLHSFFYLFCSFTVCVCLVSILIFSSLLLLFWIVFTFANINVLFSYFSSPVPSPPSISASLNNRHTTEQQKVVQIKRTLSNRLLKSEATTTAHTQ